MHTYSVDSDNRLAVYSILGFIAYVTVLSAGLATSLLSGNITAIIGGTISWGVVFGGLSTAFNRYGWKTSIVRKILNSQIPDLSGRWDGYIKTSYDGHIPDEALHESHDPEEDMQCVAATLHIKQTWRTINVHLSTANSESDSSGATILTKEGRWPSLTYQYENDPNIDTEDSLRSHDGTADLSYITEGGEEILDGFYYTGPGRENYGEMYFERSDASAVNR